MVKLIFIRHSLTLGNEQERYIGVTDESLSETGIRLLEQKNYPPADILFSSPSKRCIETAKILYPNTTPNIISELQECDFGDFENKNAMELSGNPNYQNWIDSNGTLPFPKGESREAFRKRNCLGFDRAMNSIEKQQADCAVFMIHGGTIMNLFSAYAMPRKDFYAWHVGNACGYEAEFLENQWINSKKELRVIRALKGGEP